MRFSNDWKSAKKIFQRLEKTAQKFPMIGKSREKVSNDWKKQLKSFQRLENVAHFLPTIGKLSILLFFVPAASASVSDALSTTRADIEIAREALAEQREAIAAERTELSTTYESLQADVRALREEWRSVQRVTSRQAAEQAAARRQAERTEAKHRRALAVLTEYRRAAESVMSAVQRQRYEALLEKLDEALATDESTGTTLESVEPALALARATSDTDLPSVRFTGFVIDAAGQVQHGRLLPVGPVTYFQGDDGLTGYLATGAGGLAPVLIDALPRRVEDDLARWSAGKTVYAPVDVTDGALLKVAQARATLLERIQQGGVVMIPLLLIGVGCLIIVVRRALALRRMDIDIDQPLDRIIQALHQNDSATAQTTAESLSAPWQPVLTDAVTHRAADRVYLEEILMDRIVMQRPMVTKQLGALAICAAAAPLLGLLGTVTGMIHTFQLITVFGTGDARSLSGGISEALITTQTGLMIAVPALLAHAYLMRRARNILSGLEQAAIRFVRSLDTESTP